MHAALVRDGMTVGRDQTGRLMRALGLAGVRRGRPVRTTRAGCRRRGPKPPRTWSTVSSKRIGRTSCGSVTWSATRRS
jgi:hypothetical protein